MNPALATRIGALKRSLPTRLKAAGIHFLICAAIYVVALYLILMRWYPGFHFLVDGGWNGARLMAGVDLALGPLMTLIVFNPFKARRLIVFDLCCIATLQLSALAWGFYAVHSQRPVAVSFYEDAFLSLTAEPLAIEKQPADYANQFSGRRPPLVYVAEPADGDEEIRAAMQQVLGKVMPHEDPFFFRRFDRHWDEVRARASSAEAREAVLADALPGFLATHGGQAGDYLYFPYQGRYGACTLAFRPDGALVDALGCERY